MKISEIKGQVNDVDYYHKTFTKNMQKGLYLARVEVLCQGEPTGKYIVARLRGHSRAEALKKLNTSCFRFERWW